MSSTQSTQKLKGRADDEVFETIIDEVDADDDEESGESEVEDQLEEPAGASGSSSSQPKKKKKKKKSAAKRALDSMRGKEIPEEVVDEVLKQVQEEGAPGSSEANRENVREALEQLKIMEVAKGKAGIGGVNKKDMGNHKFWATQPVPQYGEGPPIDDGYIEPSVPREQVRQDPYPLPKDFEWTTVDMVDPKQNKEVYDLLSLNYVEDDEAAFRFQYSAEFLSWALMPPGYHKEWHIGVRVASNKKLVAFISGVPITLQVRNHQFVASEINYLCVHKKLRSKRLAPVLIKEVTRQVHLKGIFQAIYTAGVVIPTPVSSCRYYHRLMNIPKLVDIRFCYVPRNMTLARMIRVNKIASQFSTKGMREMEEKDIPEVAKLYADYMKRFDMRPVMELEEVKHQFLSGKGSGDIGDGGEGRRISQVTWSYVVEDPESHKITDFFSFYSLPSTVIGNVKFPVLEAAYLFYYASETGVGDDVDEEKLQKRLESVIGDAVVVANNAKFDVFNALTLMDNVPVLKALKFGVGDGILNFYLYNWRTKPLAGINAEGSVPAGRGVGVVML